MVFFPLVHELAKFFSLFCGIFYAPGEAIKVIFCFNIETSAGDTTG